MLLNKNNKTDENELIRIGKLLSQNGYCSRRKTKEFLEDHKVILNQQRIQALNTKVHSQEVSQIIIDNKKIKLLNKHIILLNKPRGYVCSHKEQKNQKSIFRLLPNEFKSYFFAGRLDIDSDGLVVISNNGDLIFNLSHPSQNVIKEYKVQSSRPISEIEMSKMVKGVYEKKEKLKFKKIETTNRPAHYIVYLNEGKNREIRRVFEHFKVTVVKLTRVKQGDYLLDNIKLGKYKIVIDSSLR